MFDLHTLVPLKKKRKVIGRGGSRGGTSGRGGKGQTARSGGRKSVLFEGGQMPLTRRLPKRGFNNANFKISYDLVSLESLEKHFDSDMIINPELLLEKGLIKGKQRIKILSNGELTKKLIVHAHAMSESAQNAIKAQGGEVHLIKES